LPLANEYLLTTDPSLPSDFDASTQGKVTPLIDSINYFPALAAEIGATSGPGDFIYMMGWAFEWLETALEDENGNSQQVRFKLIRNVNEMPSGGSQALQDIAGVDLISILKNKSRAGVDVRVLGWLSDGSAGIIRAGTTAHKIGANAATIATVRELRRESTLSLKCCLNTLAHLAGCAHAKLVIVGTEENTVAFTGGIDVTHGRRGVSPHDKTQTEKNDYNAWHDVQVKVEGPVVQRIYDFFKELWNELTASRRIQLGAVDPARPSFVEFFYNVVPGTPLTPSRALSTQSTMDFHPVQSLRTVHQSNYVLQSPLAKPPLSFAPNGIDEVQSAWRKAIQTADTYIYVEDQFLFSSDLYQWIAESVMAKPALQVILVKGQKDPADPDILWPIVKKAVRLGLASLDEDQLKRIRFFVHKTATVHAKTTIIDDKWAIIGSANFAQRSLYTDIEHCVSFTPSNGNDVVRNYRMSLWSEHLGQAVEGVEEALQLWQTGFGTSFTKIPITKDASGPNLEVESFLEYPPGFAETWIDPDSTKEWNPCPL
jgi:phosphatidylserine/phosphatidylglycerophosphate/cardiolipin synthase-like enzyme